MIKNLCKNLRFCQSDTRIMTGIQPTGNLTIGNYLGSINNVINLQRAFPEAEAYLSIVDLHSLTTAFDSDHAKIKYEAKIG